MVFLSHRIKDKHDYIYSILNWVYTQNDQYIRIIHYIYIYHKNTLSSYEKLIFGKTCDAFIINGH